jgi:ketosteroid isomerase-like protein
MPQENVEVVRQSLRAHEGSSRTVDERLALRLPALAAANARLVARLPPSSRIRQALLARSVRLSLAAYNRRDPEAVLALCHPEFEYHTAARWVEAGLVEPSYRGLEGYSRYLASVDEVWGGENYLTPVELFDLGDRMVILTNGRMRAQASGVTLTEPFALVTELKDGRVIRSQEYYDHAEALAAAGVGATAQPPPGLGRAPGTR